MVVTFANPIWGFTVAGGINRSCVVVVVVVEVDVVVTSVVDSVDRVVSLKLLSMTVVKELSSIDDDLF